MQVQASFKTATQQIELDLWYFFMVFIWWRAGFLVSDIQSHILPTMMLPYIMHSRSLVLYSCCWIITNNVYPCMRGKNTMLKIHINVPDKAAFYWSHPRCSQNHLNHQWQMCCVWNYLGLNIQFLSDQASFKLYRNNTPTNNFYLKYGNDWLILGILL